MCIPLRLKQAIVSATSLLFLFPLSLNARQLQQDNSRKIPNGYHLVLSVFDSTHQIQSLYYRMKKYERIEGEMVEQESKLKLQRKPYKVYTMQLAPKKGLEVIYSEEENSGLAHVNPNGFPWVNLKLDPLGSIMRKKQHHTIFDAGYAHVVSVLEHLFEKYGERTPGKIISTEFVEWQGKECWKVIFDNPDFQYINYTVQEGETIHSIARKHKVSEYMVLENNPKLKDFNDVKAGDVIVMPNDYSNKMELIIEQERNIPLVMKVYDDKGVFELYEYYDVKVNPAFEDEEFTTKFKDYGF